MSRPAPAGLAFTGKKAAVVPSTSPSSSPASQRTRSSSNSPKTTQIRNAEIPRSPSQITHQRSVSTSSSVASSATTSPTTRSPWNRSPTNRSPTNNNVKNKTVGSRGASATPPRRTTSPSSSSSASSSSSSSGSKANQQQQQQQQQQNQKFPSSSSSGIKPNPNCLLFDQKKDPQQCYLGFPLCFSAPHSLELYRFCEREGGTTKRVIHKREAHTAEIILRLAERVPQIVTATSNSPEDYFTQVPPASFVVWNCATAKPLDAKNTDPNYTRLPQFEKSPWNTSLRHFREHCSQNNCNVDAMQRKILKFPVDSKRHDTRNLFNFPAGTIPLHIDLHGKLNDRSGKSFNLDVGLCSFEVFHGKEQQGAQEIARFFQICADAFKPAMAACPVTFGTSKVKASVNMDPRLHGLWSSDWFDNETMFTMTTQATLLGFHSFQLENPLKMREALSSSPEFFEAYAQAVAKIFVDIQPPHVQAVITKPGWYKNIVPAPSSSSSSTSATTSSSTETSTSTSASSSATAAASSSSSPAPPPSSSSSTSVATATIIQGHKLIAEMLHDCETKLKTEKAQI